MQMIEDSNRMIKYATKLKVAIKTFGCQMETDRDDSGSQDAEYVWS